MENPTRSEQTRNAIIEAALTVLGRDGASKLTFDAIARECGVSKGAVTHHFRSKSELLAGVLQYRSHGFELFRRSYLSSEGASEEQPTLSAQIATMQELVNNSQSPARAMLSLIIDSPESMGVVNERNAARLKQIKDEAVDPELAVIREEAAWGLAIYSLFGLWEMPQAERDRLFKRLLDDKQWAAFTRSRSN